MPVKRTVLLVTSMMLSLVLTEIVARFIVDYPDYGIERFVYGISSNIKWQPIYFPYSRYANNERGYKVFKRNNLGLPGVDVDITKDKILVLGSSFIEAVQVSPSSISVSVLSNMLEKSKTGLVAVNLGRKAHDLYDAWFRYQYYKRMFDPRYVMIVVDQRNSYGRHTRPFDFSLPKDFGKSDNRLKTRFGTLVLSSSSSISLFYRGFRNETEKSVEDESQDNDVRKTPMSSDDYLHSVLACIERFADDSGDKLVVVSIVNDKGTNDAVQSYCTTHDILCIVSSTIQIPENQIKGFGHFNEIGNRRLAELMYHAIAKKLNTERALIEI